MQKLPTIDKPLFELTIPSTNKKVLSRQFLVKEEKILLTAQQSGADKDIVLAIKQILQLCIQDPSFNSNDLATFDLEYMFLKLRAKSVNNIIDISYRDTEDDEVYDFKVDLDTVEMLKKAEFNSKIMLSDTLGLIMKYPSVTVIDGLTDNMAPSDVVEYLVAKCIDSVFDADNVYPFSECSDEEIKEFIDNLDIANFNKIREFFDSIPQMYYKIEYTNKLGNLRKIELTSLSDFFTWG